MRQVRYVFGTGVMKSYAFSNTEAPTGSFETL